MENIYGTHQWGGYIIDADISYIVQAFSHFASHKFSVPAFHKVSSIRPMGRKANAKPVCP
jgi:hypothetical protein